MQYFIRFDTNRHLQPKDRSRRGETSSLNGQTALEKLKRRRESLGLRKRSRSRDTGNKMTLSNDQL